MHPVLAKTFGGLNLQYYFRHFVFALIFPAIYIFMTMETGRPITLAVVAVCVVNTLLYPYARFVYESVVGFIFGDNVFLVNAFLLLFFKLVTMMFCWFLAIFIAPIGLIYLYIHHSRNG
ncbi:hypothetical protein A6D6_03727 [Alcanivorax xiamenensis]|uniref:Acyltransferase family protein n=1 Tax=Alcanivorax xiamenensis TaxID=1177156 RepID=A0ABQ6Y3L4_9GAMM|nr:MULTISPECIES: hypothetical protein [Alcanivorax]KAF0803388.1 hypothetical protein A6D6_03727 [Alcanivorax xiamenensis]